MLELIFNEHKAAQVAGYLLARAADPMPSMKLMRLLYLAERRALQEYAEPIIGDAVLSTEQGPVLSRTYALLTSGDPKPVPGGWDEWISDLADHQVALNKSKAVNDWVFRCLSKADTTLLDAVWDHYGAMTVSQLVDDAHRSCPEWIDPHRNMVPIQHESLLAAIGYNQAQVEAIMERLRDQAELNQVFAVQAD